MIFCDFCECLVRNIDKHQKFHDNQLEQLTQTVNLAKQLENLVRVTSRIKKENK